MRIAVLGVAVLLSSCVAQRNYVTPDGPRYAGVPASQLVEIPDTLRIVSFNIEYALRIDSALALLVRDSSLANADVILLQEMDAPGTKRIAHVLGLGYVYYPATRHVKYDRDFGNAILSRWPIAEDSKLLLPHPARLMGTRRTATAATIRVGDQSIRVYSAHLGTVANVGAEQRRDQLRAILADAEAYPSVILGGDMNHPDVGRLAAEKGYQWPTREGPRTARIGRLDHIFVKGLIIPDSAATGTVLDNRGASDHRPIWLKALLRKR